jgi:hypothetical protein
LAVVTGSFDIPKLKTKGETAIVLIVATSTDASSLFYASIPDTSPQYLQPARDTMAALKVGNQRQPAAGSTDYRRSVSSAWDRSSAPKA